VNLRNEAMLMLEHRGAVLETAARVSRILREAGVEGAVIGGIAVVLHGHVRTTRDVDVLVRGPLSACKAALENAGLTWDAKDRQFLCDAVPVQLVSEDLVQPPPGKFTEIEGITTLRLVDLINVKLASGMAHLVRAQDIADVIGLIKAQRLGASFARMLHRGLRAEYRKLAAAVQHG
jgi:hypothetical protein